VSWYPHDIDMIQQEMSRISNAISANEEQLWLVRRRLGVIATVMVCRWLNDQKLDKVAKPHIQAIVEQWIGAGSIEGDDE